MADATSRPGSAGASPDAAPSRGSLPKRVLLASLIALVSLNVWTGGPLLALWVGSRVQGEGPPSMGAIAVVAIVLLVVSLLFVRLLAILSSAYERATGQQSRVRTHAPWLRSMRGERERYAGEGPRLTGVERILVLMVVGVVVLFEVWFFFFSASPIDQRTGRSALPEPTLSAGEAR
jgi:hypothetical protein